MAAAAPSSISLRDDWAYCWRLPVSAGFLLAAWLGVLFSRPIFAEGSLRDHMGDFLGWSFLLAGVALRAWSIREIGGRKRTVIVDSGPYAACRNPLYLGTLLIAASQVFFFESLWFAAMLLPLILLYQFGVVPAEERYLISRHGAAYAAYCARTPRWRPRWSPQIFQHSAPESSSAWHAELRCLLCWLCLPLVSETTGFLRSQAWWPCLFELW